MRLLSSHIRLPSRRQVRLFWQSFLITALFIGFLSGFFTSPTTATAYRNRRSRWCCPAPAALPKTGKGTCPGGQMPFH